MLLLVVSLVLQLLSQAQVDARCYLVPQWRQLLLLLPPSHAGAGAAAASRLVSLPPDCKQRQPLGVPPCRRTGRTTGFLLIRVFPSDPLAVPDLAQEVGGAGAEGAAQRKGKRGEQPGSGRGAPARG